MMRRTSLTWLGPASLGGLLSLAACAADSGQTGSPVSTPPPPGGYQSPGRKQPERPGGGVGEGPNVGGGSGRPDAVPRPAPKPGTTALLGETLVIADRGRLVFVDVSSAQQPRVLNQLELDRDGNEALSTSLLRAGALDRLVVGVGLEPHGSLGEPPAERVPVRLQEIWVVDASDVASPRVVARGPLPEDALELLAGAEGHVALGANVAQPEAITPGRCGLGEGPLSYLEPVAPEVTGLWLERFGPGADAPVRRRELGAGHWLISSDQSHAIRIGLAPNATPVESFAVELIDLATLETRFQTTLAPADLGTPLGAAIGADYSEGVLVIAGGSRLLGFDVASGSALASVPTQGPVIGLHFLDPATLALESGGAQLARLDRSGPAPLLGLVPLAQGTPVTGTLMPFGAGYLALDGTGGPNPLLRATSYALDAQGALALVDQLQTSWIFSGDFYAGVPWRVERERERFSYTLPIDDSAGGRTGVIQGTAGQLEVSGLVATERMSPGLVSAGDTLLGYAGGVLQPISVATSGAAPALEALPPRTLLLDDVWFEVRHAGLIWAKRRTDTGQTSLSVRAGEYAEPRRVELPHAVDAIVPIDASHVAVLGLHVDGMCEYWRELRPEDSWPECGPDAGNGVSVVAVDGDQTRVVRSLSLSSALAGSAPAGVAQGINWQGYLPLAPGKWALWGGFRQECSSKASCDALGVPSYTSYGTLGCSSGQVCDTGIQEFTSGSLNESWMFPLDLTDPESPVLGQAIKSGPRLATGGELGADLTPQLLGYAGASSQVWGYPVDEPLYDAAGNSVTDAYGQSLHRWYVQLLGGSGEPSFMQRVNVPGESLLLLPGTHAGGSAEHTVYSVEPRYDEGGEQSLWLHRLRITDGVAGIDQSLELGGDVLEARAAGDQIVILAGSGHVCTDDASYRLRAVDTRAASLSLSSPLELPGGGYYWSLALQQPEDGSARVAGGSAAIGGQLSVDLNADPPRMISYEY